MEKEKVERKLKQYVDRMEKIYSELQKTQDTNKREELIRLGRKFYNFISKAPDDYIYYAVLGIIQGKEYAQRIANRKVDYVY